MSEQELKKTLKKLLGREVELIINCKICHTEDIGYTLCPCCGGSVCSDCLDKHLPKCKKWKEDHKEEIKNQVCW